MMTNQLQPVTQESWAYSAPAKLNLQDQRRLDFLASRMRMSAESGAVYPDDLPTDEDRLFLKKRESELACGLVPIGRGAIDEIINPLLLEMADRPGGADDLSVTRTIIANVLRDLPAFAIASACEDFLFGRAGDGKWRPKAGEIRQLAEMYARPYFEELGEVRAVLEFINRDVRAPASRVGALMADLALKMSGANPLESSNVVLPEDIEKTLITKYRDKPMQLSAELRKKLGCSE